MSVINFTGDLNSKFGENLPVPFIEKVKILNNNEMRVQLSLYFNIDLFTSKNFEEYLQDTGVGELEIYAALVMERNENKIYSDIISGNKSIIAGITKSYPINTDSGTKKLVFESDSYTLETQDGTNLFNFGTILEAYDEADAVAGVKFGEYYDENNNPVFRLVVEKTITISINNQLIVEEEDENGITTLTSEFGNSLVSFSQSEDQAITTFGMCCFTAVANFVPPTGEEISQSVISSKSSQISDVAYLTITKDFIVATEPEDVFVDENDELVDFVMQSIDGNFYQQQQDISNSIREQMLSLTKGRSTTIQLQSIYNSIDKIIALSPNPTFLLPQLNEIRQAFIDKSTATEVGRFYFIFDDKLTKSNVLVKSGKKVRKLSIANPRLIDQRSAVGLDSTQGVSNGDPDGVKSEQYKDGTRMIYSFSGTSREWFGDSAFIYPGATRFGREIFLNDKSFSDKTIILRDLGFFFFDYEKALRTCSDLSMLVNVGKIENFFGRSMTNNTYLLDHTKVYFSEYLPESQAILNPIEVDIPAAGQTHAEGTYKLLYTIETNFANNSAIGNKTTSTTFGQRNFGTINLTKNSVEFEGNSETNYVALRSFNTAIDVNLNLVNNNFYRLMCFEFQRVNSLDAIDYDVSDTMSDIVDREYDFYEFEVAIIDQTYQVYRNLIDNLTETMGEFGDYYDSVLESCSYDSERTSFNDFFIDSKNQEYEDNPELAPWNRIALIYHFHLDLLTDVHGGDLIKIQSAAASTSETLSPSTGNPEQIQTFNDLLNDLYNRFYNPDTPDNDLTIGSPEYKLRQARDAANSSSPTLSGIGWYNNIFDSSGNENTDDFSSQVVFGPDPTRQDPSTSAYTFGPTEINNLGYKDSGGVYDWAEDLQEALLDIPLAAQILMSACANDPMSDSLYLNDGWGNTSEQIFADPAEESNAAGNVIMAIEGNQDPEATGDASDAWHHLYNWWSNGANLYASTFNQLIAGVWNAPEPYTPGILLNYSNGVQVDLLDGNKRNAGFLFSNFKLGTTFDQVYKKAIVQFSQKEIGVGWNDSDASASWTEFLMYFINQTSNQSKAVAKERLTEYHNVFVEFLKSDESIEDLVQNLYERASSPAWYNQDSEIYHGIWEGKTPSQAVGQTESVVLDMANVFFDNIMKRLLAKALSDITELDLGNEEE